MNTPAMKDLLPLLEELCTDDSPLEPDTELLESGLLDSFGLVELLDAIEERWGVALYPSQLPRYTFSTPASILQAVQNTSR